MLLVTCNMCAMKCYQGKIVIGTVVHVWYPTMHARLSLSVEGCRTLAKQYLLSALGMSE